MCAVHHRIAHLQLAQVLDQCLDIAGLLLTPAPAVLHAATAGKQFGLGDQVDGCLVPGKALHQRGRGQADFLVTLLEFGQGIRGHRLHATGAQEVQQAFTPAGAFGQHQHAVRCGADMRLQAQQRVVRAACGGHIRQQREFGVVADGFCLGGCRVGPHVLPRGGRDSIRCQCRSCRLSIASGTTCSPCRVGSQGNRTRRAQGQLRKTLALTVELLCTQEQRLRRQGRPFRIPRQQTVALARILPEALERRLQVIMQHHRAVDRQVVEHRRRLVKEQRQVVLDAGRGNAGPHVLVDAAACRVALQQFAPVLAEAGTRRIVHRKLAPRQQAHLRHGIEAALRVRIEGADAVDFVVEQVDAIRSRRTHRE